MAKTSLSKRTKSTACAPDSPPAILLRGARSHNLKSVDVDIPVNKLTIVCGVSGSGKTSLALDTLYAEGQRRYIESFSPYTRQFLQRLDKPDYDSLTNLPAAIAVRRSGVPRSNRSTVGTTAEVDDYLRILFARVAILYCPTCSREIKRHDATSIGKFIHSLGDGRAMIAVELSWVDSQDLSMQLSNLQQAGFPRVVIDDQIWNLATDDRESMASAAKKVHQGYSIIDRVTTGKNETQGIARLTESLETALQWGGGKVVVLVDHASTNKTEPVESTGVYRINGSEYFQCCFSRDRVCHACKRSFHDSDPRTFSFNSSLGACSTCEGLGEVSEVDRAKIVPDHNKTLRQGAIAIWTTPAYAHEMGELLALANDYGIPTDVPVKKLSAKAWSIIQHGVPERNFGGLDGFFTWLDRKKYKMHIRIFAARWRSYLMCPTCEGQRLNADALAYKIAKLSMIDVAKMSVDQALGWIESLAWDDTSRKIVSDPLNQIRSRLRYLQRVGLGYLALDRPLRTLSGGEATRVTLTTSLGSDLVSMLYVLDEPTVGLHPQDTAQLTNAILDLRDRGNTVLVVEHEPGLIMKADWLVEIGPQAGQLGGKLQFAGTIEELSKSKTLTAKYLFADSVVTHAGPDGIPEASAYGSGTEPEVHVHGADSKWLTIREASGRNLKSIDVSIPLGQLVVVTGVSGSGKSTLVLDTLGAELERYFGRSGPVPLPFESVEGLESLKDVLLVDQEPISLSLRSNPATYSRVFDEIRKVFAATVDAKARGMTAGQFSFNNESGRCPRCEGDGFLAIDMQFLADIQTVCPECHGSRYTPEVLAVKYRDRSIADCLAMSILEAKEFFRGQAKLQSRLEPLIDLGLGYLQLGQSAPTLSAGEMQRLKLATYLTDSSNRSTLFILDEPTTGLHFYDIDRLLHSLRKLIASGHSVLMIEHNEQVIRAADYCIDMGPGPSEAGGQVVASGVIAEMIASKKSIFANV